MKSPLTPPLIKSLAPTGSQRIVWDSIAPGLGVRVRATGQKSFVVVYQHAAKSRWFTVGDVERVGLADARKIARAVVARAVLGQDPQSEKIAERAAAKSGDTFAELCQRYDEQVARKQKAGTQGIKLRRTYVIPKLGRKKLADVSIPKPSAST